MLEFDAFSESLFGLSPGKADAPFILSNGSQLTYNAFAARVRGAVGVLEGLFDGRQSTVFLVSENSADFVVALFALNYLAQVVVPLFPGHAPEELRTFYRTYKPFLVIADRRFHPVFSPLKARLLTVEDITSTREGDLPPVSHSRDDICFILHTSGTRGPAKGVVLTNGNILSNIAGIQDYMQVSETENCLIIRSLTHASTLVGELLLTGLTGGNCVLRGTPNTVRHLFEWCEADAITWMCVTPALLKIITDYGRSHGREINLRRIVTVGAILTRELCLAFIDTFPRTDLINAYGLTEASPRVTYLPPSLASVKPGAAGYPIKGCRVRVMNEHGVECAPGEVGEIVVAGPNVMRGYFPEGMREACDKTAVWLKTGDTGHHDADGVLFVHGRLDTMFVRNGLNIHPEYIRAVFEKCPTVSKAEVVYTEHGKSSGRLLAFVELNGNASEQDAFRQIREHLAEHLDIRKHPDEIVIVNGFPFTPSGKIDIKRLLVALTRAALQTLS